MLCVNAYYPTKERRCKPHCSSKLKLEEDTIFKDKCPFVYWCPINDRFETTAECLKCKYNERCELKDE